LINVVAIVGDYYHDYTLAKQSLDLILKPYIEEDIVKLSYIPVQRISAELEKQPDVVILFAEDRTDPQNEPESRWMTREVSQQIESYVNQGGGWIAWHSGLASYPEDSEYVKMLRGYFISHPSIHSEVTYTPTSEGSRLGLTTEAFSFMDEHYFVECAEDKTGVFLRSSSTDGESAAGWMHVYGDGRVGCMTPAHLAEGLLMPEFIAVMRRLFVWCADISFKN